MRKNDLNVIESISLADKIRGDREKYFRKQLFIRDKRFEEEKLKYRRFLPTYYEESIFTINYDVFSILRRKVLFFDLDNTIVAYHAKTASVATVELFEKLKAQGFTIAVITNSRTKRVETIASILKVPFLSSALKPLRKRLSRFMKENNFDADQVVFIGDQIMTDINIANKFGFLSVYVVPININNEPWRTRFNRMREKKKLDYFKKKNLLLGMLDGGKNGS